MNDNNSAEDTLLIIIAIFAVFAIIKGQKVRGYNWKFYFSKEIIIFSSNKKIKKTKSYITKQRILTMIEFELVYLKTVRNSSRKQLSEHFSRLANTIAWYMGRLKKVGRS